MLFILHSLSNEEFTSKIRQSIICLIRFINLVQYKDENHAQY